jgi:peptidoglycan/LPS O-acetylase OafA/YrhL
LSAIIGVTMPAERISLYTTLGAPERLPALTGVRGIAALWVVMWHVRTNFYAGTGFSDISFFEMAWYGVDIFFMLSGFILCHVHLQDFKKITWQATSAFIYLRFSRIYPVHLFTLAVVVAFFFFTVALGKPMDGRPRFGVDLFIANLFLVQSWGWAPNDSWNVLAWSISTEWFMYLLFPLIACLLSRLQWGVRALVCAALSLLLLVVSFRLLGLESTNSTYRFGVLRTFFSFLAGCFVYVAYRSGKLESWPWRTLEWVSIVWLLSTLFVWRSSFTALPAVALLILSLAMGQGAVSRFIGWRPVVYLGEISYSLYMVHMIVLELCFLPLDYTRYGSNASPALSLAWLCMSFLVVAATTLWTYNHVEKPARIYLRRLAGR